MDYNKQKYDLLDKLRTAGCSHNQIFTVMLALDAAGTFMRYDSRYFKQLYGEHGAEVINDINS